MPVPCECIIGLDLLRLMVNIICEATHVSLEKDPGLELKFQARLKCDNIGWTWNGEDITGTQAQQEDS